MSTFSAPALANSVPIVPSANESHPLVRASRLLADTAHDLKSPLAATTGLIHLVMEDAETDISAEQREHLQVAIHRCEEMQRMIDDMLALDRIRSGLPRMIRCAVDVSQLRLAVESIVAKEASQRDVKIVWRGMEQSAPRLWGDPDKLRRWLVNLINNAMKATVAGGRITVFLMPGEKGNYRLGVRDTGRGFTPAQRARLTEQGRLTSEGLGISICRQIAALHHSLLWFDTEYGSGSCFEMWLPVATPVAAAAAICRWRSGEPMGAGRQDGFVGLPIELTAPRNRLLILQSLTIEGLNAAALDEADVVLQSDAGFYDHLFRIARAGWIMGWDEPDGLTEGRRERVMRALYAKHPSEMNRAKLQWTNHGSYSPLAGARAPYVEAFMRAALEIIPPEPMSSDDWFVEMSSKENVEDRADASYNDPRISARLDEELRQIAAYFRARQKTMMT